jgi:Arc/MetJ family transcription regulator
MYDEGWNSCIRKEVGVRTSLEIDDHLLQEAEELTGVHEREKLVRVALTALIERESARKLARLGGTDPHLE